MQHSFDAASKVLPKNKKRRMPQYLHAFVDVIKANPQLITLVCELRVEFDMDPFISDRKSGLDAVLKIMKDRACNLASFWLTGPGNDPLPWTELSRDVGQSFVSICRLQTMKALHFENITDLPMTIIVKCPSCRRLHIKAVTLFVPLNLSSNSAVDFPPVPLEHISVGKSVHDFWQCYSGIGEFLSKIKTFKVLIDDHRDAGATNEILRRAAGSLGLLDVCYSRLDLFFIYRGKRIDLGLLPRLHTIRLRISDGVRQKLPHTTDVVRFLNYTTHPTSIETIDLFYSLTTTLDGIDAFVPSAKDLEKNTWRSLHPTSLQEKYPHLKELYIKMDIRLARSEADPVLDSSSKSSIERSMESQIKDLIASESAPRVDLNGICIDVNLTVSDL